MEQDM